MIVTEETVQKSLDWLVANAPVSAQARADREYLEAFTRTLRAALMEEKSSEPLGAQERYANAHKDMKVHLLGLKAAIFEDERLRHLTAAAETKIEVWRSEQANARAQGKI